MWVPGIAVQSARPGLWWGHSRQLPGSCRLPLLPPAGGIQAGSFLGLMMGARDEAGAPLADKTIAAQSNTFILAGGGCAWGVGGARLL